jgi:hypothetical protein
MANYMNRFFLSRFLLAVITITLIFASCSPTRKIIREPLKEQGTEFLFENLKANELDYKFFSSRFSAKYSQGKRETNLSGQIRMYRDSLIWVSISPLAGIEMARVLITNDSIMFINRIESTYFVGTFDYVNKIVNSTLDFDMLQSFLTGNDFSRYENTSFKGTIDNMEYKLITTDRRKLKKYLKNNEDVNIPIQNIWLNPETFKITRILIKEATMSERKAEARYSHEMVSSQLIPTKINFEVETGSQKSSIDIEYSKIVLQDSLQFPFKIPEKYNRIEKL